MVVYIKVTNTVFTHRPVHLVAVGVENGPSLVERRDNESNDSLFTTTLNNSYSHLTCFTRKNTNYGKF